MGEFSSHANLIDVIKKAKFLFGMQINAIKRLIAVNPLNITMAS